MDLKGIDQEKIEFELLKKRITSLILKDKRKEKRRKRMKKFFIDFFIVPIIHLTAGFFHGTLWTIIFASIILLLYYFGLFNYLYEILISNEARTLSSGFFCRFA